MPLATTAWSSTGKLSSPLPPASPSPLSFRVRYGDVPRPASSAAASRSMPICPLAAAPPVLKTVPLSWITLRVIVFAFAVAATSTPAP